MTVQCPGVTITCCTFDLDEASFFERLVLSEGGTVIWESGLTVKPSRSTRADSTVTAGIGMKPG